MRGALTLSIVSALWAAAGLGCAASVEEQTLLRFFEVAPTLDSVLIRKYATIGFNPRTEGIVRRFTVTSIGPEQQARKDVTIDAVVHEPNNAPAHRTLIATFQRIEGRWLVTGLRQAPASQTSREASSVPRS